MAFKSVSEVHRENNVGMRFGRAASLESGVYLSTASDARVPGTKPTYSLSVRITHDICKEARLITGDRVCIDVDRDERLLRIRRVGPDSNEKSWCLSVSGGKKQAKERASLNFKLRWVPGIPSFTKSTRCDHVVAPDGILVEIPVSADWVKCAREN